jgi:hypothetical protein
MVMVVLLVIAGRSDSNVMVPRLALKVMVCGPAPPAFASVRACLKLPAPELAFVVTVYAVANTQDA